MMSDRLTDEEVAFYAGYKMGYYPPTEMQAQALAREVQEWRAIDRPVCPTCKGWTRYEGDGKVCPDCTDGHMSVEWCVAIARAVMEALTQLEADYAARVNGHSAQDRALKTISQAVRP